MLSTAQQQQWHDLVAGHLSRGTFFLDFPEGKDWYCFVNPRHHERMAGEVKKWFNGQLTGREAAGTVPKDWQGFLVPIDEIDRIGIAALRQITEVVARYRHDFNWRLYLYEIAASVKADPTVPATLAGMWHYGWFYARLLAAARRERADLLPLLREWPGETDFADRLPTEQCLEMLLFLCRRPFQHLWDEDTFSSLVAAASPAARAFILQHRTLLEIALTAGKPETAAAAEADFYRLRRVDLACVLAQQLLDDTNGLGVSGNLPADLKRKLETLRAEDQSSPQTYVRRGFARIRRLLQGFSPAPASAPLFQPPFHPLAPEHGASWYHLEAASLAEIAALVPDNGVVQRWETHLAQGMHALTAPFLRWRKQGERILPEWQLPGPALATTTFRQYEERLALEAEETARLDEYLQKLARIPSLAGLRTFTERMPNFRSPAVVRRWQQARAQHRDQLRGRGQYRTLRMREFGLLEAQESEQRKSLWLDELLQVEEEVRPYLAYVRKAFQAALPVGSTVEFDPYRHRHDGIEFDPETVGDQDKWLRGEVMKTLRTKRNFAPITQVNTFCLDYSRSMTHELMRNLFKVVFLLVMGLEGRRSYDAIHFFGSDFYEAVNFGESHEFTSRDVLFRVLRNIAEVHTHKVIYGGEGGTNISAGVQKSHEKLKAFAAKLREEQPEMNFVSSLFVLTDGQPTVGIFELEELRDFIEGKRQDGNIAIKGIYLKPANEISDFMARIFGAEHAVDATTFEETVRTFVHLMSRTYQDQRKDFRMGEKRRRMLGSNTKLEQPNKQ